MSTMTVRNRVIHQATIGGLVFETIISADGPCAFVPIRNPAMYLPSILLLTTMAPM